MCISQLFSYGERAFNFAKFSSEGVPNQPLPPLLEKHTKELGAFMLSCHKLAMSLLEQFAIDIGVSVVSSSSLEVNES
jgi:hypothetical protein